MASQDARKTKKAFYDQLKLFNDQSDEDEFPENYAESRQQHRTFFAQATNNTPATSTSQVTIHKPADLTSKRVQDAPSVAGAKRRKRDAGSKIRPEAEQIFRGLAFFYIPDNDIAPARRIRINKAKEFGATWTRNASTATHVVVDKNIPFQDVKTVLSKQGFAPDSAVAAAAAAAVTVVNEDYPLDCIQFRSVLDHTQRKYLLAGQEEAGTSRRQTSGTRPSGPDFVASTFPENTTLQARMDQSTAKGASASGAATSKGHTNADLKGDELLRCISIMQEFKHLPLDADGEEAPLPSSEDEDPTSSPEEPRTGKSTRRSSRKTSGRKQIAFEDKFACNSAGTVDANKDNPNSRTIEVLQQMLDYYDRVGDQWRTNGYRKAIATLKKQAAKVETEEEAFRLPTIGRRIAQKIEEIVSTDRLQRLEFAQRETMDEPLQLFRGIYGVGTKQAQHWIAQGHRTLEDLQSKAKLSPNQLIGIEHYDDINARIPRSEVEALGAVVEKAAARLDPSVRLVIGGSYRRGAESSRDIDFIVTKPDTESTAPLLPFLDRLIRLLTTESFIVAELASSLGKEDGSKWHGCCVLPRTSRGGAGTEEAPVWRRIDFLLVPEAGLGAALIYFTGNDIFNRSLRLLASRKGFRLNQRGLYKDVLRGARGEKLSEGELVEGRDERRIFEILGVKWREPQERWC